MFYSIKLSPPVKALLTAFALLLFTTACDGPVGPQGDTGAQGEQGPTGTDGQDGERGARGPAGTDGQDGEHGPRGPQGPEGPQGEPGEDGNANVTLYVFDGQDFGTDPSWYYECIEVADEAEWEESHWSAFFMRTPREMYPVAALEGYTFGTAYDHVDPGPPSIDCEDQVLPLIVLTTGNGGDAVHAIHVIQIRVSNVEEAGLTAGLQASPESVIPADLDMTDYDAIVEYYGLDEDDIVRM